MSNHPFQFFLGLPASADAVTMLGLQRRAVEAPLEVPQIEAALRDRLASVYQHPHGRSPEADYVRHELRKAAEALMRQAAQPAGSASKPGVDDSGATPTATMPSWVMPRRPSATVPVFNLTAFDRLVLAALVASGGWNAESRARLVALASAHGVSVQGLMRVVQGLSQYSQSGGARLGVNEITAGQPLAPYPSMGSPPAIGSALLQRLTESLSSELKRDDPWPTIKLSVLFGVLTIVLGVIGVKLMMKGDSAILKPSADRSSVIQPSTDGTGAVNRNASNLPSVEERPRIAMFPKAPTMLGNALPPDSLAATRESLALVAQFEESSRKLAVEDEPSDAVFRRWDHDIEMVSIGWLLFEPSIGRQIEAALIEAQRTGGDRPTVSDRLLSVLRPPQTLENPLDLWRGTWKVGMLAKLAFAPPNAALPPVLVQSARAMLETALAEHRPLAATFELAARLWLNSQISALVTLTPVNEHADDFWELFLSANRAFGLSDAHDETIMQAMHAILATSVDLSRPGPLVNVLGRLLTIALESKSDVARERVLAFFDDSSIESRDLWVLTSLIAFNDAATWFPDRLILPDDADQRQRWRTRDEIATVWPQTSQAGSVASTVPEGRPLQVDAALATRWSASLDAAAAQPLDASMLPEPLLWHLIRACRLNEIAGALATGATTHAERLLVEIETHPTLEANSSGAPTSGRVGQPMGPDAGWSQSYQEAGTSVQARIDLLRSLKTSAGGDLGPIDAELFVREVYRASPIEVRTVAQELIHQFSSGPVVCMAMVDQLADAPVTDTTSRMIADFSGELLPSSRSSTWPEQARIAMIKHALDVLPEGKSEVDGLSNTLASSIAVRVGLWRKDESLGLDPQSPQDAARLLGRAMQVQAEQVITSIAVPDDLAGLQRRRVTRFRLAEGPMQEFAAHQLAILDLLAYITVAEQPAKRDTIIELLRRAADQQIHSSHVLAQSVAIEHTIAQLWKHRFGKGTEIKGPGTETSGTIESAPAFDNRALNTQHPALSTQFLARWQSRLESLSPSDPMKYFELAEEIADIVADDAQHELARHLFAMSGAIDPKRLGHSACLALAAMETDAAARQRLLALASLLGASPADGQPADADASPGADAGSPAAALALSEALGYYRRGQGTKALESLRKSDADELLTRLDSVLPSGAERIRDDCRHYKGQSRPSLSREHLVRLLRLELALLSSGERTWSGDLLLTSGRPLIEVDPDRLAETLNVNAGRPYFRTGRWVAQP